MIWIFIAAFILPPIELEFTTSKRVYTIMIQGILFAIFSKVNSVFTVDWVDREPERRNNSEIVEDALQCGGKMMIMASKLARQEKVKVVLKDDNTNEIWEIKITKQNGETTNTGEIEGIGDTLNKCVPKEDLPS